MLTPERQNRLRKALEEERDRLKGEISRMETDQFSQDTNAGVGNHPAEDALLTFTQEQMVSMRRHQQDLLGRIELALHHMDEGMYGTCERCEREIDFARLKAQPQASLCMDCQRLVEL